MIEPITKGWTVLKAIAAFMSLSFIVGAFAAFLYLAIIYEDPYLIGLALFFGFVLATKIGEFGYERWKNRRVDAAKARKDAEDRRKHVQTLTYAWKAQPRENQRRLIETRKRGEVTFDVSWYDRGSKHTNMALLAQCPLIVKQAQAVVDGQVLSATYTITPDGCHVIDAAMAANAALKTSATETEG